MTREFPRKCPRCHQRAVAIATVPYALQFHHDGQKHAVSIPDLSVPQCTNCGEIIFDELANRAVTEACRRHVGLPVNAPASLSGCPEEIL